MYISIKMRKRCKLDNGCCNWSLYLLYKVSRFLFVSVWFYYLPLLFMLLGFVIPVLVHWDSRVDVCSQLVENNCVSETEIPSICFSSCEKFRTFASPGIIYEPECIVVTSSDSNSTTEKPADNEETEPS